jgi:hypothetical protein
MAAFIFLSNKCQAILGPYFFKSAENQLKKCFTLPLNKGLIVVDFAQKSGIFFPHQFSTNPEMSW